MWLLTTYNSWDDPPSRIHGLHLGNQKKDSVWEDWGTLGKIKGITSMCGVTGFFFECLQARSDEMRSAVNQLLDREILGRGGWLDMVG